MPDNLKDRVRLSYLQWLETKQRARRDGYDTYREYYDGDAEYDLMERAEKFLDLPSGVKFDINICDIPVDVLAERLAVTGLQCKSKAQQATMWDWWVANRMDGQQKVVHRNTLRDGDAYVVVEYDDVLGMPRFTQEPAMNGTYGVEMVYGDDHQPRMAWRKWRVNTRHEAGYVRRKNYYLPDQVQKWISDERVESGQWREYKEDDESWPIWWTDNGLQSGEPLGIPVVHFRNKADLDYGVSELHKAIPVQNLFNKAIADLIMSADVDAFSILTLMGFSKEDIEDLRIAPGAIIYNRNKDARVGRLQPADVKKMMDLVDFYITKMAQTTRTPLSYFQSSRQISSGESQKQGESPLLAKVKDRWVPFGNAWEDVLKMGCKLHNVFGSGEKIDSDLGIEIEWKDPQTRNELEMARVAKIHQELGVPEPYIWPMLGYTPEEVKGILESDEYQSRLAMAKLGLMAASAPSEGEEGGE